MPAMSMWTTSPAARVKSSGGTMPVPVSRMAPLGKLVSLPSQAIRSLEGAGHLSILVAPSKTALPAALDLQADGDLRPGGHGVGQGDDRAEGAGAVVDLGLRQIERVLAFDVARAHVVADGVADELAAAARSPGPAPARARSSGYRGGCARGCAGAGDAVGGRLEEQLGRAGRVDQVVKLAAPTDSRLAALPGCACR